MKEKISVKKCVKHGELNESNSHKEKYKDGFRLRCKECRNVNKLIARMNKEGYECKHHGWLSSENIRINEGRLRCRICHRETAGLARKRNRKKANAYAKRDRELYPEKYKKWRDDYRSTERGKEGRIKEHLKRNFQLTIERYHEMVNEQENKCAICGENETRKSSRSNEVLRLSVDHNHKTGMVRALLCHDCNTGLGKFRDSTELLCRAIEYLERFD